MRRLTRWRRDQLLKIYLVLLTLLTSHPYERWYDAGMRPLPISAMLVIWSCMSASPCDHFREPVRTGVDAAARRLRLSKADATQITIADIVTEIEPNHDLHDTDRERIIEDRLYVVAGTVSQVINSRGSIVLTLRDKPGNTLRAVIPDTSCIPATSRFAQEVRAAHKDVRGRSLTGKTVRLFGLLFYDQRSDRAGNGVVMEPVTAVEITAPGE